MSLRQRLRLVRGGPDTRPPIRAVLKDVIFLSVPAKPAALFMYLVRLGLLDGRAGLRFCFFHAWYEASVAALGSETNSVGWEGNR